MRPDLGPEGPCKRASISKATFGCPASRSKFSRALATFRNGKKPPDFSGFRRCSGRTRSSGASEPFGAAPVRAAVAVIAITIIAAVAIEAPIPVHFAPKPVEPPAFPAAGPAVHVGQDGKPAL